MAIWDWFSSGKKPKREAVAKRRRPKRFFVELLENRANLSLTPLPTFEAPFTDAPVVDTAVYEASAQIVDAQAQALDNIQSAQATTQYVVDGYMSLLYELQQEVPGLADLPPLEPTDLIHETQLELDAAIDRIGATDQPLATHWSETRSLVRQLEITLDEITTTVGELAEAQLQNHDLAQQFANLTAHRRNHSS